jgi:glutathione S-transferase
MTDIILHHYETSPYSEKVRLGLGLKGLSWASVEIPAIMPKPNLTALTGGYRKTPVLQIGADIYCDSQLIMSELERQHPSPSFYPTGRGAADALAWWAEKTMFTPAASLVFAKRFDSLPDGFLEDPPSSQAEISTTPQCWRRCLMCSISYARISIGWIRC